MNIARRREGERGECYVCIGRRGERGGLEPRVMIGVGQLDRAVLQGGMETRVRGNGADVFSGFFFDFFVNNARFKRNNG